jgi:RNA polymerase sigma-70 factor (ECF subfamily)
MRTFEKTLLYATSANTQPAFVVYRADDPHSSSRAFGLQVVTLDGESSIRHITEVTTFTVPSLVTSFGFPLELPRLC